MPKNRKPSKRDIARASAKGDLAKRRLALEVQNGTAGAVQNYIDAVINKDRKR
jgi:hypothetical protein